MARVRIIKAQTGLEAVGTIVNLNDQMTEEYLKSGAVELVDQPTAPVAEEQPVAEQDAPPADVVAEAPEQPQTVEVKTTN